MKHQPTKCLFACVVCDVLPNREERLDFIREFIVEHALGISNSIVEFKLSKTAHVVFVGFPSVYNVELNVLFTTEVENG